MSELLFLSTLGVPDEPPFERSFGTRAEWAALGIEVLGEKDMYGWIARWRGEPTARLWTLDMRGDGWSGTIWGSAPVQGHGVTDGPDRRPFYFRARHDAWSLSLAEHLALDPIMSPSFIWSEDYENASYMEEDVAVFCIDRALAIFRDPLVTVLLRNQRDPVTVAAAWAATRSWHAMAAVIARDEHALIGDVRHALWKFGIHPRMDRDAKGRLEWDLPLDHTIDASTYTTALAAAGSFAALDAQICDVLRPLWSPDHVA